MIPKGFAAAIPSMIITRTPLRISIGGGGTDLPSYYEKYGGFVISAAINKYVFIGINRTFTDDYFLKYSGLERVKDAEEVRHPIIREILRSHRIGPALEIVSLADIPAGTGLGSSGSFTVGLLRAIYALQREHVSAAAIAEEACNIEINMLGEPVGKQDQYIASFGGLNCFEFEPGGSVRVNPLKIPTETLHDLEEHLLMFFTGYSRNASVVLEDQKVRSEKGEDRMLQNLHYVKQLASSIKTVLEGGDARRYGELMHDHWLHKRQRSAGMSNDQINGWYEIARASGAVGGKLVGAGGGGFLLFYAEDRIALRQAMAREGLVEMRFQFDHDGSVVVARG
jgi:D-glycero-alpha-D-manno-heptose-7-phosphate kinase